MSAWTDHVERWRSCTDCQLCEQRDRIVLARGSIPAEIVFVGEAPGDSENTLGIPFAPGAPAGRLLQQIIDNVVPVTVSYALTNLVACFPRDAKHAGTNEPAYDEIEECRRRLLEFLVLAQPKLIVCVGRLASDYIPPRNDLWDDIRYADIVHPAAILRMPKAQQNMAVQKATIILRGAIEDTLQAGSKNFTNWGDDYAHLTKNKQYIDYTVNDPTDIPF